MTRQFYIVLTTIAALICICAPLRMDWAVVSPDNGRPSELANTQFRREGFWQLALGENVMAVNRLRTIPSKFGSKETMDRLETEVKSKGLTVFARIDHAAGAAAVGLPLRPTELLIFGNAKGGTPLMQAAQTMGIDLPLKVLVWQDASGKTWLSYNDPSWLAKRHGLDHEVDAAVSALTTALNAFASAATASP